MNSSFIQRAVAPVAMSHSAIRLVAQGSTIAVAAVAAVASATAEIPEKSQPIMNYHALYNGKTLMYSLDPNRDIICKSSTKSHSSLIIHPQQSSGTIYNRQDNFHTYSDHIFSSTLHSQYLLPNFCNAAYREILSFNKSFSTIPIHSSIRPKANLGNFGNSNPWKHFISPFFKSSSSQIHSLNPMHTWHFANPGTFGGKHVNNTDNRIPSSGVQTQPATVVLLGWLGAKQRNLRRYAEWYSQQGVNAITFIIPMVDVLSLNPGGKAEEHVDSLVDELYKWLSNESPYSSHENDKSLNADDVSNDRVLLFHTFSNTGWLVYGAVLKKLKEKGGEKMMQRIRGCVVDSAPVVAPDPQVWASGFSAALIKGRKRQMIPNSNSDSDSDSSTHDLRMEMANSGFADVEGSLIRSQSDSDAFESTLKILLQKFFTVFLSLPTVKSRLSEMTDILSNQQPSCPQLYIYSDSDTVIPVSYVESFIAMQKVKGQKVKSQRLENSPHVDHFRTFPEIYKSQLTNFMHECIPSNAR